MSKILNLVVEDCSDFRDVKVLVESFQIREDVSEPEKALRNAVQEFVTSDTKAAKDALERTCSYFNWGDALSSVPDSLFEKHGLTPLNINAVEVVVDHDEVLWDDEIRETEDEQ